MNIKNYYIEKGHGDVIIFLHGNNGDGNYFSHQIDYFSQKYRVIALDTRGHGKTPRGTKPFSLATFADDLYVFMKNMDIEKAHIVGFSDGANIAMLFALKYPECVKTLVINGGNISPDGVEYELQRSITDEYKALVLTPDKTMEQKRLEEMLSIMVNEPYIKPSELANIKARTFVVAGTFDLIKREHTELIYKSLPNAELLFIDGGHLIAAENPQTFNKAVEEFLKKEQKNCS
ncbi:MAG: alpha/beta hydrolase [Clostridia bacterium]|nr:alpha/beta hydrolase [Clostridia bacterium]